MEESVEDPAIATAFTVQNQAVELDFSFCPRSVKGKTTIEIQPQSQNIREIHLHCRQLKPTNILVSGRQAAFHYNDLYDRLTLHPGTGIEQFHFTQDRLRRHETGTQEELVIFVPEKTRIKEGRAPGAQDVSLESLLVEIEYTLEDFRDAVYFAGVEDGDARYPHVYTRNSPFAGTASALFPCVDDGSTRCNFDVSVRYPRTVGDALSKASAADGQTQTNGARKADSVMSESGEDHNDLSEEEKALEMSVICSGLLTDEIVDPNDPSRMTASFMIDTPVGILPQHVGIVIGPLQHVDLSEYRDTSEDDRLQDEAIKVHAFCLPGKEDEVRNSAMMVARTLDNFTDRYQTYRFGKSYKLVFVDDLDCDTAHTMSLTICSSRLLFPETVWEPLEHTTRVLIHAVASQWIGVDVIAQEPSDQWVIVGGSWFMTEFYLRELFGRNDNRFRQKVMIDKIVQTDLRRPSLYDLGPLLELDQGDRDFMELKALSVLSVLHNRLVKASGKNGVDRCLYRLLFNHGNGTLNNGAISTEAFLGICEKVGHQKLDNFFRQWVYGSGCPTFECTPSFNKKKQVVNITITQTQAQPVIIAEDRNLGASDFMREAKERSRGFFPDADWPAFVGPMTIRIHEADGTPYEHIVDINSSSVKVEIPYNTKYKRLKRNRLNKERMAAAQGFDATGETQEDVTFYSLGDLFQTPEEAAEWRIEDWPPEDEAKMEGEAYEWIRVDADFEWICKTNINDMPSYMYVSQLQQDKDVVAQAESIQYLSRKVGHGIISSFLAKTLMDSRYFHGIRTMAADVLPNCATEATDMIGLFHLTKAFRELFCIPSSPMTRSNDFSDRASYLIQCAIPKAISKIKGPEGKAPMAAKRFLLDVMRYNDNRGNDYSDDHYLAMLMRSLTECIVSSKPNVMAMDPTLNLLAEAEEHDFRVKAIGEIDRHKRLDEWIPTYQNIYTTTTLNCEMRLIMNHMRSFKISEFLDYTQMGNADNVRLNAWECLMNLGVFNKKKSVIRYMLHEIQSDPSPYFRTQLLRIFGTAIGQIAIGDVFELDDASQGAHGGLVVEEEIGVSGRAAELARRNLDGALRGLKVDVSGNKTLQQCLEDALRSKRLSLSDVSELVDVAGLIADSVNKLEVVLKYPHYWKVEKVERQDYGLWMRFYHSDHFRTSLPQLPQAAALPEVIAPPVVPLVVAPSIEPHLAAPPPPPPPPTVAPPITSTPPVASAPPKPKAPGLKIKLKSKTDGSAAVPIPNTTASSSSAPVSLKSPEAPLPSSQRASSIASQGILPPPAEQKKASPGPSPAVPEVLSPPTLPTQSPSSASLPPRDLSEPMVGIESTGTTPIPPPVSTSAPAPVPAAAPTPKAASKQSLKLKTSAAKPLPKAPKQVKGKKSRVVKLHLAPEKLALFADETRSKKRKANGNLELHRPSKRQSTEPPRTNGARLGHHVRIERTGGEKPRLLLKVNVGRGNLPME